MKANVKLLKKRRIFDVHFKKQVVSAYESGQYSVRQLGELYKIHLAIIYRWIHKYSSFNEKGYRIVEHKQSSTDKLKQLKKENQALKVAVGEKQILIDYLEKLIEIAGDELQIDIKKNFDTPPSGSSNNTKQR